jgi:hypothetical protein
MRFLYGETKVVEDALGMGSGYVLNFSDRTFSVFFDQDFGIDIDDDRYRLQGTSKAKRLRCFFETESEATVSRVLRRLWEHRETIEPQWRGLREGVADDDKLRERFFTVIERLEGGQQIARTDVIDHFDLSETLEELVAAIERDINANRPVAALDRLHTYSMKKFGHLLDARGIAWDRGEPLQSRVGKYVRALREEQPLHEITLQIAKNAIGVFEKYNDVRNKGSLAHDNVLPGQAEARFIYDGITAFLRFVKSIEANRFGS